MRVLLTILVVFASFRVNFDNGILRLVASFLVNFDNGILRLVVNDRGLRG